MKKNQSEQGSALMLVVIIVLILVGISFAFMTVSWWSSKRAYQDEASTKALYIAESAAAVTVNDMIAKKTGAIVPVALTSLDGGAYWVPQENVVDFSNPAVVGANNTDPDFASFQVAGKYNGVTRRINILMTHKSGGVFWNAIYAGNSSKSAYALNLSGGSDAGGSDIGDKVFGNIYSNGDVNIDGLAATFGQDGGAKTGTITATGTVTNSSTTTKPTTSNTEQPALEIPRSYTYKDPSTGTVYSGLTEAEYNAKTYNSSRDKSGVAWIDVAGQSAKNGTSHKWADGSTGTDITDVNNPAHIFRKDPSSTSGSSNNRTTTYEFTAPSAKSDFYLEDPTNAYVTQAATGLNGNTVNGDTTASMLNVKDGGNNAVYFIDGNMRVSGEPIKSYQLAPDPKMANPNLKMTIMVKGNVSLTDNLLYPSWQSQKDSVAIIAITDPAFPNTTAADFTSGASVLPGAFQAKTGKTTAADFVKDYNSRASSARSKGLNMPDIDLSTASGQTKASQEYNKVYGSGNVYFGDPGSGTVEHFEAFMYAENNFYATNLDSTKSSGGTSKMEIFGNMTAGNQVNINRSTSKAGYIPLNVTFDPAIMNSNAPPGLPKTPTLPGADWRIVSWKQSAMTAETSAANEK